MSKSSTQNLFSNLAVENLLRKSNNSNTTFLILVQRHPLRRHVRRCQTSWRRNRVKTKTTTNRSSLNVQTEQLHFGRIFCFQLNSISLLFLLSVCSDARASFNALCFFHSLLYIFFFSLFLCQTPTTSYLPFRFLFWLESYPALLRCQFLLGFKWDGGEMSFENVATRNALHSSWFFVGAKKDFCQRKNIWRRGGLGFHVEKKTKICFEVKKRERKKERSLQLMLSSFVLFFWVETDTKTNHERGHICLKFSSVLRQ